MALAKDKSYNEAFEILRKILEIAEREWGSKEPGELYSWLEYE